MAIKTYLVGGAVRNKILGLPVNDYDYVVVGAKEQDMLDLGYKKVGKDFPVFIDPKAGYEYALARSEKKIGKGYLGFITDHASNITLQKDLERRDLTINAIAMDKEGNIYDPFGGQEDIKNSVLRHVSSAFSEDPLRILRLARFKAELASFNFQIAEETTALTKKIMESNEIVLISKERIWKEFSKAFKAKNTGIFIKELYKIGALKQICSSLYSYFKLINTDILSHEQVNTFNIKQKFALFMEQIPLSELQTIKTDLSIPIKIFNFIFKFVTLNYILNNNLEPSKILILLNKANAVRQKEDFQEVLQLKYKTNNILSITSHKLKKVNDIYHDLINMDINDILSTFDNKQIAQEIYKRKIKVINSHLNKYY